MAFLSAMAVTSMEMKYSKADFRASLDACWLVSFEHESVSRSTLMDLLLCGPQ